MASQQVALSPAELAYLHSSLSLQPPIRPDGRSPTQFRPLTAETGVLPATNGSARVCFSDGSEAIVGIKAELEKTVRPPGVEQVEGEKDDNGLESDKRRVRGRADWVELAIEIPGQRDDEASTVFLGEMLREALLGDGELARKLIINTRFHWRLYVDVLLISPPLSYPLPLLSLTTHLALLATRIPRLKSEGDEDPMFDDDWEASSFVYPRESSSDSIAKKPSAKTEHQQRHPQDTPGGEHSTSKSRPAITLLVVTVGENIIFDPAKEELAVAEAALAVSISEINAEEQQQQQRRQEGSMDIDKDESRLRGGRGRDLKLLAVRMIDPPSRLTPPGIPHGTGTGTGTETEVAGGTAAVWRAPQGGTKVETMTRILEAVLKKGGVADEVLDGLDGVEIL